MSMLLLVFDFKYIGIRSVKVGIRSLEVAETESRRVT